MAYILRENKKTLARHFASFILAMAITAVASIFIKGMDIVLGFFMGLFGYDFIYALVHEYLIKEKGE